MIRRTWHTETEMVFKQHYREFCLLSYSYVLCMDQAEDIVQDVFLKILTRKETTEILNLKAYIWNSVKNTSLKNLERSKKTEPIKDNALALPYIEESQVEDGQLGQKLQQAMDQLPQQCRNVFELCAVDGQKYDYAADRLGISKNTVKTQMKKAYKILRGALAVCLLLING